MKLLSQRRAQIVSLKGRERGMELNFCYWSSIFISVLVEFPFKIIPYLPLIILCFFSSNWAIILAHRVYAICQLLAQFTRFQNYCFQLRKSMRLMMKFESLQTSICQSKNACCASRIDLLFFFFFLTKAWISDDDGCNEPPPLIFHRFVA